MGSDTGSDDEKPVHKVYLADYYIDKYETTNAQYISCMNANKCSPSQCEDYKGGKVNQPVVCIDWMQAKNYCEFAGKRLPTEAEWEKAARGTDGRIYPWGNDEPNGTLLNYNRSVGGTTEVGSYPKGASLYGVMDMAGNVREWTSSDYKAYPYIANDGREGLLSNNNKVLRSGSWITRGDGTRVTNRDNAGTTRWDDNIGSRCVR